MANEEQYSNVLLSSILSLCTSQWLSQEETLFQVPQQSDQHQEQSENQPPAKPVGKPQRHQLMKE
jgi:hypothetical protein